MSCPKSMTVSLNLALILISGILWGQDYQSRIYQSYIHIDMEKWKRVMEEMESEYRTSGDQDLLYELAEAEYGYTAYCISVKQKEEAREVLHRSLEHIQLLLETDIDLARIYSLQGAFFGFRFFLEPLRSLKYRSLSLKANQKAISLGFHEPQAWMEKANIAFYTPAFLGGSKEQAVHYYEKAVRLYESYPYRTQQNWIYLNCMVGLAFSYEKTGQIRQAGEVYRKLLGLEPAFKWVRDELYPGFQEKHSTN